MRHQPTSWTYRYTWLHMKLQILVIGFLKLLNEHFHFHRQRTTYERCEGDYSNHWHVERYIISIRSMCMQSGGVYIYPLWAQSRRTTVWLNLPGAGTIPTSTCTSLWPVHSKGESLVHTDLNLRYHSPPCQTSALNKSVFLIGSGSWVLYCGTITCTVVYKSSTRHTLAASTCTKPTIGY